jgi:death on curing protein
VSKQPIWLEPPFIIAIHEEQIAQHGGLSGLRDRGLLESAMARPQHLYAYGEPTIFDMAAAYAGGIVKNHPFADGNKRTGFMAGYTFLRRNGMHLRAPQGDAVRAVLALASSEMTEEQFARWLEANCRPSR